MSCKIIKERERITKTEYSLEFTDDDGSGFSFPCDVNGNVFADMADCAKENLRYALDHPEKFTFYKKIRKRSWTYTEPAIAKCICEEEFELINEYEGACECPNCGRWYNMFGQELLNPKYWEEEEIEEECW